MCGIAGISVAETTTSEVVEQAIGVMVGAIKHRGPDDQGTVLLDGGRVGLGNTRLAIMDLSQAGHQPMFDSMTGNWIVFNGEIYNHWEVRAALGSDVTDWASSSDTETILKAYRVWGAGCLAHFRGMFAIAIWDLGRNAIWCARDRFGMKPLYYFDDGTKTLFASEVRPLLRTGLVPRQVDPLALAGYVRFGAVPEPHTLISGIRVLPAGHFMWIRNGSAETPQAYWKPEVEPESVSRGEAAARVRELLERSVREHLIADVPVAVFLSGGVDSSIVTVLAAKQAGQRVQTVTLGFAEEAWDESAEAEITAKRLGTEHHGVKLEAEEIASMVPEAVRVMDRPTSDGINTYVVSKITAQAGLKVVLSGLGADELFGGYRSFGLLQTASRTAPVLGWTASGVRSLVANRGGSIQRGVEVMLEEGSLSERYESIRSLWSKVELEGFGLPSTAKLAGSDFASDNRLLTRVSWLEMSGYMRSTLLRDSDVMSMAHSLELRLPFLDHELVEYCLQVGAADFGRGSGKKQLLFEAAGDLLSPGATGRKKKGFDLPMGEWMRGPLKPFVAEGLKLLAESGLLPGIDLSQLHERFLVGQLPWARLWQFVVLGHWVHSNI